MTDPPSFREAFDSKIHFARLCRHIVVNRDAEHAETFLARLDQPVLTYGLDERADIRAESLSVEWRDGRCGTRFTCRSPWYDGEVFVGLPGRFHVSNALAALTCAALEGVDPGRVAASLARATVPGCMEPVKTLPDIGAYVDTARSPQTLERMLSALREYTSGRVTVVFGCDGNTSASTRAAMGRVAALGADRVYSYRTTLIWIHLLPSQRTLWRDSRRKRNLLFFVRTVTRVFGLRSRDCSRATR